MCPFYLEIRGRKIHITFGCGQWWEGEGPIRVCRDGGGEEMIEISNVNLCRCHIQNFYWSGGTGSSVAWTSREDNEQIHICMISTHYYKQLVFSISICLLMFSRSICCASIFNWFSSWYFWNIACSSKKTKHLWEDVLIFSVIETQELLLSDLPELPPDPPHGRLHVGPGHCSPAWTRLAVELVTKATKFSQSHRRPLLGPVPGWKQALSYLRHYLLIHYAKGAHQPKV